MKHPLCIFNNILIISNPNISLIHNLAIDSLNIIPSPILVQLLDLGIISLLYSSNYFTTCSLFNKTNF